MTSKNKLFQLLLTNRINLLKLIYRIVPLNKITNNLITIMTTHFYLSKKSLNIKNMQSNKKHIRICKLVLNVVHRSLMKNKIKKQINMEWHINCGALFRRNIRLFSWLAEVVMDMFLKANALKLIKM
jgi:hypothetical protein